MQGQHRYSIYVDHKVENWLIISGVGEIKASTATEYLSEVSDVKSWTVWVNIGIAGSSVGNYGDLFLIDKIIQDSSKKCFYLGAVVKTKIQKSVLVSHQVNFKAKLKMPRKCKNAANILKI